MRRQAKAPAAGSTTGRLPRPAEPMQVRPFLLYVAGAICAGALLLSLAAASPAQASLGVFDYWGNPSSAASEIGGEFSTTPAGVAVNAASGDVYVVDSGNHRVQQFSEDGEFIRAFGADVVAAGKPNNSNEVQAVRVSATEGQFKLTFGADTTADLPFNAGAAAVQTALNGLASINAGGGAVSVAGGPGNATGAAPYLVTFGGGPLAGADVAELTASAGTTPLGGAAGASVATTNPGATGFEICDTTAPTPNAPGDCKKGAGATVATGGAMNGPRGIAIDQISGALYVTDQGFRRIDQFSASGSWLRSWGRDVVSSGPHDNGADAEICLPADVCKEGIAGSGGGAFGGGAGNAGFNGYPAIVPTGSPAAANAGNVIVGDPANLRVQEFTPGGAFVRAFGFDVELPAGSPAFEICTLATSCKAGVAGTGAGQFSARNPQRVAADSTGAIYTVEPPNNAGNVSLRVQKLVPQAGPPVLLPEVFAPTVVSGTQGPNGPTAIAVDPSDDHVFVVKGFLQDEGEPRTVTAESRVLELDSAGNLLDAHIVGAGLSPGGGATPLGDLAIKPGGGPAYHTSTTIAPRVYRLDHVPPPSAQLTEATDVMANSAVVHGSINPNGGPLTTSYRIEYSVNGKDWIAATADVDVGNGEADVPVAKEATGLPPNKVLQVRIFATKLFNGATTVSNSIEVKTAGKAPGAQTGDAWWNGSAELALSATVNPNNGETAYFFQYGPTVKYGDSVPVDLEGFAGDGEAPKLVVEQLYDLDTDTTFHYRILATNPSGTTVGADRVVAPHSQSQVYELVSDGESNGIGLTGITAVSDDGQRALVGAQTLGDPPSLPSQINPFVAERGASGWTVPSFGLDPGQGGNTGIAPRFDFSADLSSVLFPQRTVLEAAAGEAQWTLSRIDGSSEPAAPHLSPIDYTDPGVFGNQGNVFVLQGSSLDLSTFVFKKMLGEGAIAYLPGEPLVPTEPPLQGNIYQATGAGPGATLSLVNRDPSGDPLANVCGAWVGVREEPISNNALGHSARAVSSDGSVVYFSARPGAPTTGGCDPNAFRLRIFKRIDDSSTVEVSQSQCTRTVPTPCSAADGDDVFEGASADGEVVLFTSTRQLTDSDEDATNDLYLYDPDPPAGQPTLVQVSAGEVTVGHPQVGSGADVQGVIEESNDGSRVYFVASGQLTADAVQGASNLFVYERSGEHPSGRIAFVAALSAEDALDLWAGGRERVAYTLPFYAPGGSEDGDGHMLVFASAAQLLPGDADFATDLYRYDDETGELLCFSCDGNGAFHGVAVKEGKSNGGSPAYVQQGCVASEDGSTVAFTTNEAILPEDENSAADVYAWQDGELRLISGPTGQVGAAPTFGGGEPLVSPDGKRVFFLTKAALHPSDQNSALDVYAASIGSGLPLPRPAESKCEDGQSCRGDASSPPPASPPASSSLTGPGNVVTPPGKVCKKPKVRRKGRCVRKKAKGQNQHKGKPKRAKRTNNGHGGRR